MVIECIPSSHVRCVLIDSLLVLNSLTSGMGLVMHITISLISSSICKHPKLHDFNDERMSLFISSFHVFCTKGVKGGVVQMHHNTFTDIQNAGNIQQQQ